MKANIVKNLMTTGFVGLAGATLMGMQTNEAHAATATVNYQAGATTVWTNPNNGQPARYLTNHQQVTIQNTQQINGQTWYQVGANEWVSAAYLNVNAQPAQVQQTPVTITASYQAGATTIWTSPTSHQVAGYLPCGQSAQVLGQQQVGNETYYHIQQGWVPAQYVVVNGNTHQTPAVSQAPVAPSAASQAPTSQTVVASAAHQATAVASQQVVHHYQATTNQVAVRQTTNNVTYQQHNSYVQQPVVRQINATTHTSYAQQPQVATTNNALSRAASYLGTPYQWGGNQPGGFDCSGFVQHVYGLGSQYRTSQAQSTMGQPVSVSSLKPGDLCFWGQPGSAYHVAIWAGNGRYIAAPAPGQSVSYGSTQYYAPTFGIHMN